MTRSILMIFPDAFGKRPLLITIIDHAHHERAHFLPEVQSRLSPTCRWGSDKIPKWTRSLRSSLWSRRDLIFDIPDLILLKDVLSDVLTRDGLTLRALLASHRRIQTMESERQNQRPTRHSCGWLYVEKKVDKLSPGSLKAWAERSTHSSRPLLFFLPLSHLSSSTFFTDTPPPPSHPLPSPPLPPFAPSSSSMLYALFLLHSLDPSLSHSLACSLYFSYTRFTSTL